MSLSKHEVEKHEVEKHETVWKSKPNRLKNKTLSYRVGVLLFESRGAFVRNRTHFAQPSPAFLFLPRIFDCFKTRRMVAADPCRNSDRGALFQLFASVAQTFQKISFIKALASRRWHQGAGIKALARRNPNRPSAAQIAVPAIFIALGILAAKKLRPNFRRPSLRSR